jgi:hypothetical protein
MKYPDDFEVVWHGAITRPGTSTKGELLGEVKTQNATQVSRRAATQTPAGLVSTNITQNASMDAHTGGIAHEEYLIRRLLERHNGNTSRPEGRRAIPEPNPDNTRVLDLEGTGEGRK